MAKIKCIVMDVDGVLTDGRLIMEEDGQEWKAFHSMDGLGITLAKSAGIRFAIITGRKSGIVSRRAKELGIDEVHQGIRDKFTVFTELVSRFGLSFDETCYIGDDLNDLMIMREAGFSCAPRNAAKWVKQEADYVTEKNGGEGAVREVIDLILSRQYDYEKLALHFLYEKVELKQ
ncbi:3-deoxy-D-manno-octulosonate 8-phosphate phosphatase [Weizmannia acidilactici]|uniref:3-deoxy-D-manno-octulosonate 8-phosphate phosphatase n=1 Tax=Weizmannia acidilactici TaxID=2607726 RepID=A0A5J4JL99_9BACI|nr:HAD-IIIA family hydrolase [Weizmannia acidilactici]GER67119.1 3-deoxy-D-manno-octulosonate 8-phosphate phosphatase [Weizmannia acidilactici]GER71400.1 3-deoxy-D-manno-octulosonate 8-phosphate phosphatase [Weizmannia acidilactici]GER74764.1 3-deoxy-D-manno-octulosonate 8-phosphate phosphatase [Weizmannia acidilactici]